MRESLRLLAHVSGLLIEGPQEEQNNGRTDGVMELCVNVDMPPRPGTRSQVVVLVVILVLAATAARAGYPVPVVVISTVISGILGAAGIRAGCQVPVLAAGRGDG
jgi:hypothetical protein